MINYYSGFFISFILHLGLIFSSLSGYDIRESVKLWERMAEKNKGKEPPVFLSTHPSSKKRIENLNDMFEVGQKIPVEVISKDEKKLQIGVSIKALLKNPFDNCVPIVENSGLGLLPPESAA